MLVLGLILVALAVLALVAAFLGDSGERITFDLGSVGLDMTPAVVFLLGAASVLTLVIGLGLIRSGVRGAQRRRKKSKELTRLSEKLDAKERDEPAAPNRDSAAFRTDDVTDTRHDDRA